MPEKIVGYLLLASGLIVILFSGFSVYQVFTKKLEPVQLFNFDGIAVDLGGAITSMVPADQQEAARTQIGDKAKQEIIPNTLINDTSNLAAHLFLMGFIASIGYKIASLGIQMIRPIVVKVREASEKSSVVK